MCYEWRLDYTRCGHVSKKLVNCAIYHKQREVAESLFGRLLLHSEAATRNNCGRVLPHHVKPQPYFCSECTTKHAEVQARRVRNSAPRVHRPPASDDLEPSPQRTEKRTAATRKPVEAPQAHRRYGDTKYRHIGTTTGPMVQVPDLSQDPRMSAGAKSPTSLRPPPPHLIIGTPGRPPEPAKGERHRSRGESVPKKNAQHRKRGPSVDSHRHPRMTEKPQSTHRSQHRAKHNRNGTSPFSARSPPTPPQGTQSNAGASPRKKPFPPCEFPPCPNLTKKYPPLRRKPGQVFGVSPIQHSPIRAHSPSPVRSPSPIRSPPRPTVRSPVRPPVRVPTPKYQAYLNAVNFAAKNAVPDKVRLATARPDLPPPSPRFPDSVLHGEEGDQVNGKGGGSIFQGFFTKARGLGQQLRPASACSDMSFMCLDSKRLSQARRPFG